MVGAGEHDAYPRLLYEPADLLRPQLYLRPECLKDVRASRLARRVPVAVFGDRHARAARHERRGGRDVDRALRVAAGAAGVHDVIWCLPPCGETAHRAGGTHELP